MKTDKRPMRHFWAPGSYMCKRSLCNEEFAGDKRAQICADCAYIIPLPITEELLVVLEENECSITTSNGEALAGPETVEGLVRGYRALMKMREKEMRELIRKSFSGETKPSSSS